MPRFTIELTNDEMKKISRIMKYEEDEIEWAVSDFLLQSIEGYIEKDCSKNKKKGC